MVEAAQENLDHQCQKSDVTLSKPVPDVTSSPSPPPPRNYIRHRESYRRYFDRSSRREHYDRLREHYDRNRSPPQEKYYNKRGRSSPSPPPPPYRDRHGGGGPHSPSQRRSPPFPSYKRRREDIYDGRRGSPRAGDRRFGYEREDGGRTGNPDDRSHGRYMGRSSGGYQDLDSGRGAFSDTFNTGGIQREGMMSYKQFIQELEDDILPTEAERRYQEYRTEYISTQKKTYFNSHKDKEWLKDKYHPTSLLAVIERRNEIARKLAKDFQLDLQSGTLDLGPEFSPSSNKTEQPSEPNSEDEADVGGRRKSDFSLTAPKAHPVCCEPRRIQIDIEQSQTLARKLDTEKGIEDNILCRADNDRMKSHGSSSSGPVIIIRGLTTIKGLEGIELLDTLLTYLWRIHGVDYYGLVVTNEAKGGLLRHIRADNGGKISDNGNNEWEKKLDSRWQERLKNSDPLEVMTAKEKIDATAAEALDPFVRKIRDEKYGWKYGCGAKGCTKLFHASEFVLKHLKLKHPELVMDLTSKVRHELYFQNYMNDENAPGGTPIMQPSLKEKHQRRIRPAGPDNRVKDERENHRENENAPNSSNGDEAMFGGIPVAAFPSDIPPPPVLMPVPGAGPLGPFVPAPPEVAMQMLRDQGGPEGGSGGRNGSGPSPIIALPPRLRPDPRRLRSYTDLDAPDDEVTVIDYRSL